MAGLAHRLSHGLTVPVCSECAQKADQSEDNNRQNNHKPKPLCDLSPRNRRCPADRVFDGLLSGIHKGCDPVIQPPNRSAGLLGDHLRRISSHQSQDCRDLLFRRYRTVAARRSLGSPRRSEAAPPPSTVTNGLAFLDGGRSSASCRPTLMRTLSLGTRTPHFNRKLLSADHFRKLTEKIATVWEQPIERSGSAVSSPACFG